MQVTPVVLWLWAIVACATVENVCCTISPGTPPSGERKKGLDLLDLERCGPNSSGLTSEAKLFDYPWMAIVREKERLVCGGTLINSRYVLTAAHCVKSVNPDSVRLGEFDRSQTIDCDQEYICAEVPQDIPIERAIIHPNYSRDNKTHDIALLRLTQEATLNNNVIPICLPVTPAMQTNMSTYLFSGWGATETSTSSNKLKVLKRAVLSTEECLPQIRRDDQHVKLYDTQLCTSGMYLCQRDSGGPIKTVSVSGRFVQYGVVSFGYGNCDKTYPEVHTKVESYIDWILDQLEP